MKRILFRADAKPSIGIGDLMSLINLSDYFNPDEWECFFMIRSYQAGVSLISRINNKYVTIIDEKMSLIDEIDAINNVIVEYSIDLLFFEITERPLSEYKGITDSVKIACVNFDHQILDNMKLVINWDVDAERYMKKSIYSNTTFLLGAKYVILPKQFYSLPPRIYKIKPESLLIAMGGADEFDFTAKIIGLLIQHNIKLCITVIVGSGYVNLNALKELLLKSELTWEIKQDVKSMLDEYLKCDIAIGAGGLTASELVATGTPALLIATYSHQIARCQYFHDKGLVTYLGYKSLNEKVLLNSLFDQYKISNESFFDTYEIVRKVEQIV